jgi:hypothetical protein
MKSNYGPVGEVINMRWKNGVCVPVTSMELDRPAAEQAADDLFLELFDKFQEQWRSVSHSKAANNYAHLRGLWNVAVTELGWRYRRAPRALRKCNRLKV